MSLPQRTTTRSNGTQRKMKASPLSVRAASGYPGVNCLEMQSHQIYPQRGGTTHGSVSRITKFSLKRWGMEFAKRRGSKRAKVVLGSQDRNNPAPHVH